VPKTLKKTIQLTAHWRKLSGLLALPISWRSQTQCKYYARPPT